MDKNKISQIYTIIIVGIMIALVGTVAVTKLAKRVPTTTTLSENESVFSTEPSSTAPTVSKETVPMGGNSVITTITGQKPQWKIEEEASVSASIAHSKSEASKKNQQKNTTKAYTGIVPSGRANIIASYEKGINNLKKTKKFYMNEDSSLNITIDDITGGFLVQQSAEALLSQLLKSEPKSYDFKDGVDSSSGLSPKDVIPPFEKTLKMDDSAIYSATAKATSDGGYTVTIKLKDEKQTMYESAKNHEKFTLPVYIDEVLSPGAEIENYELIYSGTTITALFDKNNRITYLEHHVSAPTVTGSGTLSLVPFDFTLSCNYITKYDVSYL